MTAYPSRQVRRVAALLCVALHAAISGAWAEQPEPARQQELLQLLRQDCGSCHGMQLTGGLGPALTVAAVQHKSDRYLTTTILDGRPQQAMPAWRGILNQDDAAWLVTQLKTGLIDD